MKHIILAIGLIMLAGCEPDGQPRESKFGVTVYVDTLTGCEYVNRGTGLYPRIDRDGKTHRGCGL